MPNNVLLPKGFEHYFQVILRFFAGIFRLSDSTSCSSLIPQQPLLNTLFLYVDKYI